MTPERQRIVIAEFCGWTDVKERPFPQSPPIQSNQPTGLAAGEQLLRDFLPDYLNDLNAIHEAEKRLDLDQRSRYLTNLHHMHGEEWGFSNSEDRTKALVHAIGKWEEDS